MTTADRDVQGSDHEHCGCCGRQFPRCDVAELGDTPGVFLCVGCALSLARRAGPGAALRHLRFAAGSLRGRLVGAGAGPGPKVAIPILPSTDLERTAGFYSAAGFTETERHDDYLVMHLGPVEMHFSLKPGNPTPVQYFIHVGDAVRLRKQLRQEGAAGLGPVEDQDYGLREFVLTDPDGHRIRLGSPAS